MRFAHRWHGLFNSRWQSDHCVSPNPNPHPHTTTQTQTQTQTQSLTGTPGDVFRCSCGYRDHIPSNY
jgi:hypothetical protein